MESAYKRATIIWAALLVAAFMYVLLPELLHPTVRPMNSMIVIVIAFLAVTMIVVMMLFRKAMVEKSEAVLKTTPGDKAAMQRWMTGQLLTVTLAEAIVLYGLVLRFMGADRTEAIPFYVVGIGAMIVFRPKRIE